MSRYIPDICCFTREAKASTKLMVLNKVVFNKWFLEQDEHTKHLVLANAFTAKPQSLCYLVNSNGQLMSILVGIDNSPTLYSLAHLPFLLEEGVYSVDDPEHLLKQVNFRLGWAMGSYQFTHYKKAIRKPAQLLIQAESTAVKRTEALIKATYLVRTLVNIPAEDMAPVNLAQVAQELAKTYGATLTVLHDEELLAANYPTVYAVGRAAEKRPCLIDLRWGDPKTARKKITLVGKGVTFDSGGLDLKTHVSMLPMKKDKCGGASVFALALAIMEMKLPVELRVLVPAVENAIGGNAYRPGDVIKTRSGITVEVGDTDFEGRLILCDAISEAITDKPDLMIDFTTLTLEARCAVGSDISAFFCNNDNMSHQLIEAASAEQEPVWQLPLYQPYRSLLDSDIADINNSPNNRYSGILLAGATTAALFLETFVPNTIPWIHFDVMGTNITNTPGRPRGGEAMGVRASYKLIEDLIK